MTKYYTSAIDIPKDSWRDSGQFRCYTNLTVTNIDSKTARVTFSDAGNAFGIEQQTVFQLTGAPVYLRLDKVEIFDGSFGKIYTASPAAVYKGNGSSAGSTLVQVSDRSNFSVTVPRPTPSDVTGGEIICRFQMTMGWSADGGVVSPTYDNYTATVPISQADGNNIALMGRVGAQMYSDFKYKDEDYIIPEPRDADVLAMSDYQFTGWATSTSDLTVRYVPGDVYSQNRDLTLIGMWRAKVDVNVTSVRSDRVSEDGNYDDASTYARTTAVVDVMSIWNTETRISIEAPEANVSVQTEPIRRAVTIFPSNTLVKPADDYESRTTIVWDSIDDAVEFTADKSYAVTVKADVYNVDQTEEVMLSDMPSRVGYQQPAYKTFEISGNKDSAKRIVMPEYENVPSVLMAVCEIADGGASNELRVVIGRPDPSTMYMKYPMADVAFDSISLELSRDGAVIDIIPLQIPEDAPTQVHLTQAAMFSIDISEYTDRIAQDGVTAEIRYAMRENDTIGPDAPEWADLVPRALVESITFNSDKTAVYVMLGYPETISAYVPPEWRAEGAKATIEYQPVLIASASKSGLLLDAEFVLDFHTSGKGMAIGGIAPEHGLDIGWDTKIDGTLDTTGHIEAGGNLIVDYDAYVAGNTELDGTLAVAGETSIPNTLKTGNISLVHGSYPKISRPGSSTSWISGHKIGSVVQATTAPSNSSYSSMLSMATEGGNWSVGVFRNNLSFSYITNGNLNSNQNVAHCVHMAPNPTGDMYLPGVIQKNGYWGITAPDGTDASYIRTPANGLLPHSSNANGTSVVGTSSWPFHEIHCAKFINLSGVDLNSSKTLWSGMSYMTAGHTATLSQARSAQPNGIILIFRVYNSGSPYGQVSWFVPNAINGNTYFFCTSEVFGSIGAKVLGIWDTSITGNGNNTRSATKNGITYNNAAYVLTQVIGV